MTSWFDSRKRCAVTRSGEIFTAIGLVLMASGCVEEGVAKDDGGGATRTCMDSSEHSADFDILDDSLCVVAKHAAPFALGFAIVPSWGRHGGLLTLEQSASPADEVTLRRWTAEQDGGALVEQSASTQTLGISTMPLFMNPQAIDLPFGGGTLLSWAEFGTSEGEAIVVEGDAVTQRFKVAGMLAAAAVGEGDTGQVLHTSFSAFEDLSDPTQAGLYAAELCAAKLCTATPLALGGDASGVVAVDHDGNAFVALPDLAGDTQVVRAFAAAAVEPGASASAGSELMAMSGSGLALAALAPSGSDPGLVFFQPFDAASASNRNVVLQRYRVEADTVVADGATADVVALTTAGTSVSLTTGQSGELWVGLDGASSTATFYVIARR